MSFVGSPQKIMSTKNRQEMHSTAAATRFLLLVDIMYTGVRT
jgi:hypothetical protein